MTRSVLALTFALGACADTRDDGSIFTSGPPAADGDDEGIEATDGNEDTGDGDGNGSDDDDDDDDDGPRLDLGMPDTGDTASAEGGDCECAPKSDLVYLLSDTAELWLFDPSTLEFTKLGSFDCGVAPTTFSMGVARDGTAWIMFQPTGEIFLVDVNDANTCMPSGWQPSQFGYNLFGMGFSSPAGGGCDDLFLHSFDGGEWAEGESLGMLARVNRETMAALPVAPIDYNGGELTGTGDGRLFAFAGAGGAKLVEYDRASGEELAITQIPNLELTYAFAFAFWGGDFYFFTESGGIGTPSRVTWLDHDQSEGGGSTTVVAEAPLRVVGAGVSTCAPITPPG